MENPLKISLTANNFESLVSRQRWNEIGDAVQPAIDSFAKGEIDLADVVELTSSECKNPAELYAVASFVGRVMEKKQPIINLLTNIFK